MSHQQLHLHLHLYLEPVPADDLLRLFHHVGSEVLGHLAVVEGQLHVLVLDPGSVMAGLSVNIFVHSVLYIRDGL